jgi:hypothetical protein
MPRQVTRLSIAFGRMILGLVLARQFLVPKTIGELGDYRARQLTPSPRAR